VDGRCVVCADRIVVVAEGMLAPSIRERLESLILPKRSARTELDA